MCNLRDMSLSDYSEILYSSRKPQPEKSHDQREGALQTSQVKHSNPLAARSSDEHIHVVPNEADATNGIAARQPSQGPSTNIPNSSSACSSPLAKSLVDIPHVETEAVTYFIVPRRKELAGAVER